MQDELKPYSDRVKGKSNITTQDMHLHALPWPADALRALPHTADITLRVTLSYFVEPNPGRRGNVQRHRYQSHGLGFSLIRPLETLDDFKARVNKQAQDDTLVPSFQGTQWALNKKLRNRGSIHSDWWTGSGAELAECHHLAVFPTTGWWKERPHKERWRNQVRYALVISIETPETNVDLYTPVANAIQAATAVPAG